ncbi:MAG TPA: type II CRISPR-associated endonuclease Cas1 [Acholeplasmataceae bacterium]|nr:type II CRISPR-associated endonuclease Cas1 [Acholeplasmataceae bacterium]
MGWRIVYIEDSDYLSLYLDNINIKKNDQDILIPISDIHTLIIDNYKAVLSVNLINKCTNYKVNIVLCGFDHLPQSIIHPCSGNNQSPKILKQQLGWDDEIKGKLQQLIVKKKIENQAKVLIHNSKGKGVINKLNQYAKEVLPFDSTNREGLSAKVYFRELFGQDFMRFDEDSINAGLNYGYAIVRSQITKVLISRGLNTSLGIFHKGPNNTFNLSDDIIEIFRPLVDNYVYNNIKNDTMFSRHHRLSLIKLTTKKMLYDGQKHTFLNIINIYVRKILDCFVYKNVNLTFPELILYNDI